MLPLSPSLSNPLCFRRQNRAVLVRKECGLIPKAMANSSARTEPAFFNGFGRRDLVLFGLSSSLFVVAPSSGSLAEEELKMASVVDHINAYSYLYPLGLPSKNFMFKWVWYLRPPPLERMKKFVFENRWGFANTHRVESRKPERYSSAAPLSPDARLRIVSERVDIIDNLIISVSIGPPNFQILKSKEKSSWSAKDVADSVLSDKSALRVTSTQRLAESSILDAHSSDINGEPYWFYEYLVRKSPTKTAQESNLYRHYVASTAERDGYLYTLNASTLGKQWTKMGPFLEKTVSSFRLLLPTENYVPPYKDPWRFW